MNYPGKPHLFNSTWVYWLEDVKKWPGKIVEFEKGQSWLYINCDENDCNIEFALFEFCSSNLDDTRTEINPIFIGRGVNKPLGEMRHIYWGEVDEYGKPNGYTFFLNIRTIKTAFEILSEFFYLERE